MLMALLFFTTAAFAQNTFKTIVKDVNTNKPLAGATVKVLGTSFGSVTDTAGLAIITNIPNGMQRIQFSYLGFALRVDSLTFPIQPSRIYMVTLENGEEDDDLEEVVVSATRSSRTIANIPTRVEVISGEELDEKANMKPGDIRMLLAESTGIQTQQTSATSANSSIRIQGLDGKYTQIIRDGFPLYSGFSGGLGLLQVAPLDLQQVEVIKGSSSTLYGGGAIAGLVNLVSKKPTEKRQLSFLLNGTSALGLDLSSFYSEKFKKIGITIYAAYNKGTAYDPSNIGLTAIPKYDRFTVNPKLFFYLSGTTTLTAGINATTEKRIGGDMEYLKGNGSPAHSFFEENKTGRYSSQLELEHRFNDQERLVVRNSVSYYDRSIGLQNYLFSGVQVSTYSEANYSMNGEKADWVLGLNYLTDNFKEDNLQQIALRSYNHSTTGLFAQNTWSLSEKISIESGIRGDHHSKYGFFLLPKLSALWKISEHLSTRLGGGLGYKAPTVFTEDAERIQFVNVLPVNEETTKAERSYGFNYDVNYRTSLFDGKVGFSINQLFFYTRISNPIRLELLGATRAFIQPDGFLDTKGLETNAKITYGNFKLFIGYTLADVHQHTGANAIDYPLVSKHRLNNVLMYELEDKWKIGAEAYYFSSQPLNNGETGKSYWTTGFLAERIWERFSLFINFENFTDTRQTKFGPIYTGTLVQPLFKDIYAPVDGFVMNGGIKVRL